MWAGSMILAVTTQANRCGGPPSDRRAFDFRSHSTDISLANYDFRFIRAEYLSGQLCYKLELLPRRKDQYLLRGNIWVDANTYQLRRSEGEPANKSPSWWLRNIRIELAYDNVGGMWLQTASDVTVDVRIFGQYTMVTRDLEYRIGDPSVGSVDKTIFPGISPSGISATEETAPGNSHDEPLRAFLLQIRPRP